MSWDHLNVFEYPFRRWLTWCHWIHAGHRQESCRQHHLGFSCRLVHALLCVLYNESGVSGWSWMYTRVYSEVSAAPYFFLNCSLYSVFFLSWGDTALDDLAYDTSWSSFRKMLRIGINHLFSVSSIYWCWSFLVFSIVTLTDTPIRPEHAVHRMKDAYTCVFHTPVLSTPSVLIAYLFALIAILYWSVIKYYWIKWFSLIFSWFL